MLDIRDINILKIMDEPGSESEYSETTNSQSSTAISSLEKGADGSTELAKIGNSTLKLPKGLCENAEIFRQFFSISTWNTLPDNFQAFLKNKYLPEFPEQNEKEKQETLNMLFNNEIKRFNQTPLNTFYRNLEGGLYRPDIVALRKSIAKSRRREYRFQQCENVSRLAKSLLISRTKFLRNAYDAPPETIIKVDNTIKVTPKMSSDTAAIKAKKRAYHEIRVLASQIGIDYLTDEDSSDKETFTKAKMTSQTLSTNESRILGTMCNGFKDGHTKKRFQRSSHILNDENLHILLKSHKRRKLQEPDRPDFDTSEICLQDVLSRTNMISISQIPTNLGKANRRKSHTKNKQKKLDESKNLTSNINDKQNQKQIIKGVQNNSKPRITNTHSQSDSEGYLSSSLDSIAKRKIKNLGKKNLKKRVLTQNNTKGGKKKLLTVNGSSIPDINSLKHSKLENPKNISSSFQYQPYTGKVKAATYSDLEGIDMMHLPIDLDEDGNMDLLSHIKNEPLNTAGPELMQETHICFLSLIRDIFCSTPNHRMRLEDLKSRIYSWLTNPITALNDWYSQADNWLSLIPSAIHFLSGEFSDQPEDFVPYLEYKAQMNIYQWIGAGRDSDQHLLQLYHYWLTRRNEMGNRNPQKYELNRRKSEDFEESILNEEPILPPPPRFPTNWTVQPATSDEILEFRMQERRRFENPHRAFTYRMHGYESVVGPVKGVYTQMLGLTKARGHNMLTADRPNYVTILTLVRDATARLPNGEGTRADICELLKSSQYINAQAQDPILQTIVSGALDRMHTEYDPCVRYEPKRKIWIYLHRNRNEEEFERIHQQSQSIGKPKKASGRKIKPKSGKLQRASPIPLEKTSSSSPSVSLSSIVNVSTTSKAVPALCSLPNTASIKSIPPLKMVTQKSFKSETNKVNITLKNNQDNFDSNFNNQIPTGTQKTQIISQTIPTLVVENKVQNIQTKKLTQNNFSGPGSSNFSKLQSTHQTINTSQTISSNSNVDTKQRITANPQSHINSSLLLNQAATSTPNQIFFGNRKITKPLIINQAQTSTLVSQVTPSASSYIIPINIGGNEHYKAIASVPSTLIATSNPKFVKSNHPPNLTTSMNARTSLLHQPNKNLVRVATTTAQTGKTLITPHIAANNISLQQKQQQQQQPKLVITSNTSSNPLQQKTSLTTGQINVRPQTHKTSNVSVINNPLVIKSNNIIQQKHATTSFITPMQKQQRQNIVNMTQSTVVTPSGTISVNHSPTIQTKPVIITPSQTNTQQIQKVINVSSPISISGVVQTSTNTLSGHTVNIVTSPPSGANLMNSQIIQIQQTSQPGGSKIQSFNATNLTPQQQQNLLNSIKQHQLKNQNNSANSQQSLVIKQQPIFHHAQKQNVQNTIVTTTSANTITQKPVGTHLIQSHTAPGGASIVHQQSQTGRVQQISHKQNIIKQQNVASSQRVVKSNASIVTSQFINNATGNRPQNQNPVMAKVLTNPSGQIISIESLLQKQGTNQNTTLRVARGKNNNASLIQLANPPGSQITQYAVVAQDRSLISVANPPRLITTQTTNSNNINTSLGNVLPKISDIKTLQTIPHTSVSNQTKVISTNSNQSVVSQQIVNAKVLGKTGPTGIRMVNASNLNIAHIRGKPVIITSKPTNVNSPQTGQNVILQGPVNSTNLVLGGPNIKVHGNIVTPGNVQVIGSSNTSQPQTVVLGNQLLKVQQNQTQTSKISTSISAKESNNSARMNNITTLASTTTGSVVVTSNQSSSQSATKTVVLGSGRQAIRLQSPSQLHTGSHISQGQVVVGTPVKNKNVILQGTPMKSAKSGQQRVVLAVQGGGQILLPPNFQGGAINLKNLQGVKVVSLAQHQQPNKGKQISK